MILWSKPLSPILRNNLLFLKTDWFTPVLTYLVLRGEFGLVSLIYIKSSPKDVTGINWGTTVLSNSEGNEHTYFHGFLLFTNYCVLGPAGLSPHTVLYSWNQHFTNGSELLYDYSVSIYEHKPITAITIKSHFCKAVGKRSLDRIITNESVMWLWSRIPFEC